MHVVTPILLAAADQIIILIVGLAVLVIWIIGQIAEARKLQPPRPDGGRMRDRQPPPDQAEQLRAEVEEFLRQASGEERRPAHQLGRPEEHRPDESRRPRRSSTVEVLIDDDPSALEAEVLETASPRVPPRQRRAGARKAATRSESDRPAQQVVPEGAVRTLVQRTSHLGERVALADEKISAHVHAKFDHAVGRLGGTRIAPAEPVHAEENAAARQIAQMLSTPQGMRQAIVLSEILTRPEQRWSSGSFADR